MNAQTAMQVADLVFTAIERQPVAVRAAGMPVIFNGRTPRIIGWVHASGSAAQVRPTVDALLIERRLSAERISIATLGESATRFVLCHG